MAPNFSKYPITASMVTCIPPSSGKQRLPPASPQSDSLTSLAYLRTSHVDSYPKQVVRHIKNLFQKLPENIASTEWSILADSSIQGIPRLIKKFTIKQACVQPSTILEALMFLKFGFLHSQVLLTKITQVCNDPKIDEAELAKLKKMKEPLIVLTGFLDTILMTSSHHGNISNLPIVKDIKRIVKKLGKLIAKIKPQCFSQLIPDSAVTEEDLLCSVLGLEHDVADRLRSVNPVMRSHRSDLYFLQCFLADEVANPEVNECLTNTEAVSSKLQDMGFTQSRSVVIANWIAEQPYAEHWSLLAWAQHYIENLFTYDIFLNDDVCRYPYEEKKQDVWFSVPVKRDEDEDGKRETGMVQGINTCITGHDGLSKLIEETKQKCNETMPGQRFYFHGTDHKSAKSILEDGIRLEAGSKKCDFSGGKGFYLADNAWYAYEWAKKNKAPALLIFAISDQCLNERFKGLDLSPRDRKSDWTLVKNHFRKIDTKKLKENKSLMKELNKSDYIKGPISRDGTEENLLQNVQQICIRTNRMADDIGSLANIFGVIFSNTN